MQVNKQLGVLIDSAHQEAADLEQEENVRMVEVRATISDCTIEGLTRGDPSQLWGKCSTLIYLCDWLTLDF